jgi:hypothetical protein
MSNELEKSPHTVDGFAGYSDEVEGDEQQTSNRVIQGEIVKFTNEASWVTGAGEELPADLELVVIDVGRIVQKWNDGIPVETRVLQPGEKFPDIAKLNETVPKKEWVEGPDGKPRGPWQSQHVVYLLDPRRMGRYTWPTGTVGGAIAVRDIVDRCCWMRKYRGAHVYPVVRLSNAFMPTRFGGRQRPYFDIVKWVSLDGGGAVLTRPRSPRSRAARQRRRRKSNHRRRKKSLTTKCVFDRSSMPLEGSGRHQDATIS